MSKYNELYNRIKKEITDRQIDYGEKLPSVRKASEIYGVSRTTVQNAYFALSADGYIISEPQSGYYVSYRAKKKSSENKAKDDTDKILFDFTTDTADRDSFDFNIWRRYIKSALRQDDKLLSYGEAQGELLLREAIADYVREKRNVTASADRIVIGAGVQTLLSVFCSLIDNRGTVSFPDKSFVQGASLFADYGFDVKYRNKDARIIYVTPSKMTRWGDVMPNKRRIELVAHSAENGSLVIEDDFESDFLYNTKPAPSLHALSGGSNVVYLGSFSKLLLPSIRISFMILTEKLAEKYRQNIYKFNQTASKTEQIALYKFINDGHLKAQIRKTRRFYTAKTKLFAEKLKTEFPSSSIEISENALQIIMKTNFDKNTDAFLKNGIKIFIDEYKNGRIKLCLNTSSISEKDFDFAVKLLKKALI